MADSIIRKKEADGATQFHPDDPDLKTYYAARFCTGENWHIQKIVPYGPFCPPKVCTTLARKEEEEVSDTIKIKTKLAITAGGEA